MQNEDHAHFAFMSHEEAFDYEHFKNTLPQMYGNFAAIISIWNPAKKLSQVCVVLRMVIQIRLLMKPQSCEIEEAQ